MSIDARSQGFGPLWAVCSSDARQSISSGIVTRAPTRWTTAWPWNPTLHKLFDAGVWSLTDDRRVLVSADFTGTDATVERIRGLHGETIRSPLPGESPVSVEYIRWHRESDLGGVFHRPALPL